MSPDGSPGRFRLIASAVCGRPLEIRNAESGDATWTDGVTVYLDERLPRQDQLSAVVVQASLLAGGSLAPDVTAVLRRRPALARRYLALEGHRSLSAQEDMLPPSVVQMIDVATAARGRSPADSLAGAARRDEVPVAPPFFGELRPAAVQDIAHEPPEPSIGDRRLRSRELQELHDDDDGGGHAPDPADLLLSPVGGGGGLGKLLKKLFRESSGGGPPGADSPTHFSRRGGRSRSGAIYSTSLGRAGEGATAPVPDGIRYPEWDHQRARYRPDWCTVREVGTDISVPIAFDRPDTHALRRPLTRLGTDLQSVHRQMQGDDIDIDAAVEARVQLLAGVPSDDRCYIEGLRRKRDLSVLLLLDLSGSAGEPSHTGEPVFEHQRAAAAALATTLQRLGDRVALWGFRSQGRGDVRFSAIKTFDDHFDSVLVRRLGSFRPGGYTRLGAAVRHGTTMLECEGGTSRRLLVVLSDGLAYDHGYERAYGEADARRALSEGRRNGIGCLCISVGARTSAQELRRVFGTAAYAAVPRVEQLPAVIGPLFRSALASAESARRTSHRSHRSRERQQIERRVR